jgi:Fuc2NAc and GlcNAc transferase
MLLLNLAWLLPLAYMARLYPEYGFGYCVIAYIPLILIAYLLKAGRVIVQDN